MSEYGEDVILCAESYRKMVAQLAWKIWRKLPSHTRNWLSIEDLIEDGMGWVVTVGIPKYRPECAGLSTFLYVGIGNFFKAEYLRAAYTEKRYEGTTVGLDDLCLVGVDDKTYSLESRVVALQNVQEAKDTEAGCWVVPMMVKVFKRASALLQKELRKWFLGVRDVRLHIKTKVEFWMARQEFLELAEETGVAYADCEHLLSSKDCLREFKFCIAGL